MFGRVSTWAWLGVGLVLGGLSFAAGRLDAQSCGYNCANTWGECLYSGSGTIVMPKGNCLLKRWDETGSNVNCNGSATQSVDICVGKNGYCYPPAAGQFSRLGDGYFDCGSCSGTTTIACCQSCS